MRVVLSITGASGTAYGIRLAKELSASKVSLDILVSGGARKVIKFECKEDWSRTRKTLSGYGKLWEEDDFSAPFCSGSNAPDAVVVCPCSMKTLAAIANGYSDNIISRSADVAIKERRKLILVPREMPFSAIHLENMLKLARLGVVIMPPQPGFYNGPKSVDDMVGFVAGRIMDELGIKNDIFKRWDE